MREKTTPYGHDTKRSKKEWKSILSRSIDKKVWSEHMFRYCYLSVKVILDETYDITQLKRKYKIRICENRPGPSSENMKVVKL